MSHERDQKSLWAVNLGLGSNILLAGLKTLVGISGQSPALLAEGINSTSDVAYYVVASIFMRLANKPADNEHPYGHRQLESIASVVVGAFVVATGVAVFWNAIDRVWGLINHTETFQGASPLALWVALLTIAAKIFLTFYVQRLGRQTQNPVVMALAFDHRNDLYSASAAALGIFLGQQGIPWVDPLAGALVALLILRTGIHILRESSVELMDAVPSQELAELVRHTLLSVNGVEQLEEMQAHRFGPHVVINITIGIDGGLTVSQGDAIASRAEKVLQDQIPNVRRVHVHYHPAVAKRKDMSIEQILAASQKNIALD